MKYYIIKIGNGLYYNKTRDKFTCYLNDASWFKDKQQAERISDEFLFKSKVIEHKHIKE